MIQHQDKTSENKTQEPASNINRGNTSIQLKDNRKSSIVQQKLAEKTTIEKSSFTPIQRKNNTGLPDNLKSGIENLSGHSMDDVKVHYNSSQPAQLNAHAYAQGSDIHIASGQEKHLPHEAWHVVQQKQGRVKPTLQMKSKVNINDDKGLENEADVMGAKAIQTKPKEIESLLTVNSVTQKKSLLPIQPKYSGVVQRHKNLIGGNPKGRGGKSKKNVRPKKDKPSYGKAIVPHNEKKVKVRPDNIVYRLLTLGGELHFDEDTLSRQDQNKVKLLIKVVRSMADALQEGPIIGYLEAIGAQIRNGHAAVDKVVLMATKEGEHGSYAPTTGIIVMSVGTINEHGELELRNPFSFLQTLVHEFTHVMDISLRKRTKINTDESQEPNDYDLLVENHPSVSEKLKAMLSKHFYGSYSDFTNAAKWSEVIAHFSELGVLGVNGPLIKGFKEQWIHYYLPKYQATQNQDEAMAYADEKLNTFMSSIIHGVILPFVNKSNNKAIKDFFYGIILEMPSAREIAKMEIP